MLRLMEMKKLAKTALLSLVVYKDMAEFAKNFMLVGA